MSFLPGLSLKNIVKTVSNPGVLAGVATMNPAMIAGSLAGGAAATSAQNAAAKQAKEQQKAAQKAAAEEAAKPSIFAWSTGTGKAIWLSAGALAVLVGIKLIRRK